MSIVFMGGEMASFTPSGSGPTESTAGGFFDGSFSRCSVQVNGTSTSPVWVDTPVFGNLTTSWTHVKLFANGSTADLTTYPAYWLNAAGVPVVRIVHRTSNVLDTVDFEYSTNGTTWTATGVPVSVSLITAPGITLDVKILCNSVAGNLRMYNGGTKIIDATVDLSGIPQISKFRLAGGSAGGFGFQINFSECIISASPTIGLRLLTRYPSANGTNTAWSGSYTDVNEIIFDDATQITSSTLGQLETFQISGPAMPGGYFVKAVGVYARGNNSGTGIGDLDMVTRVAGTNYVSPTQILDVGLQAVGYVWDSDPSTALPWANAAIGTLEIGVKSDT